MSSNVDQKMNTGTTRNLGHNLQHFHCDLQIKTNYIKK